MRIRIGTSVVLSFLCIAITGMSRSSYAQTPVELYKIERDVLIDSPFALEAWNAATEQLTVQGFALMPLMERTFVAPRIVFGPGFKAYQGSKMVAGIPTVDVHFVNYVNPTTGFSFSSQSTLDNFCRHEVDILNFHFTTEHGYQIVKFRFKDAVMWGSPTDGFYSCITNSADPATCDPISGDGLQGDQDYFMYDFDRRDDNAINFILYDRSGDDTSGGNYNRLGGPPYVIVDYARVNENLTVTADNMYTNGIMDDDPNRRAAEEHEMGHAFALGHVAHHTAHPTLPSSMMQKSTSPCAGVALPAVNHRDLGFFLDPGGVVGGTPPAYPNICQEWRSVNLNYVDGASSEYGQAEIVLSYAKYLVEKFN